MSPPLPADQTLQSNLLAEIAARGNVRSFPSGTPIIVEGDESDSLYIILSGRVKVFASNEAGREIILSTPGPGEYFGELALDGGVRSASVSAMEPTRCAVVNGATLRDFLAAHPDFALHLIRDLIRRVRRLTGSVKSLALEDVYTRVAALLNELAEPAGDLRIVRRKLTQQDIAEHVGSSREMISRIFKELVAGAYVRVESGQITLLRRLPAAW